MIPTAFALLLAALLPAGPFSPSEPPARPVRASPAEQATSTPAATATPVPATSPAAAASPSAAPPSPEASETPPALPAASGAPNGASPSAGATSSPLPGPSLSPGHEPAVVYDFRFVPHQPEHPAAGTPQIFAIYLNSNKLKSLGPIDIKVSTGPDVVKVYTHSNGRDSAIPMVAPGDFEALGKIPRLPIIASGITTTLEFVAVGSNGKRVSVSVPVHLQ